MNTLTLIDRVEGLANRGGVRRDFLLQIGILSAKGLSKNVFQLKSIRPHLCRSQNSIYQDIYLILYVVILTKVCIF